MKNKDFGQWLIVIIVFPLAVFILLLCKIVFSIMSILCASYYLAHAPLYEPDSEEEKESRNNMSENSPA